MAFVTKCDACGKDEKQPINWLALEVFGKVSINQPPFPGPRHFCSIACVATWAEAQVLADKKYAYRLG